MPKTWTEKKAKAYQIAKNNGIEIWGRRRAPGLYSILRRHGWVWSVTLQEWHRTKRPDLTPKR